MVIGIGIGIDSLSQVVQYLQDGLSMFRQRGEEFHFPVWAACTASQASQLTDQRTWRSSAAHL